MLADDFVIRTESRSVFDWDWGQQNIRSESGEGGWVKIVHLSSAHPEGAVSVEWMDKNLGSDLGQKKKKQE